MDQMIFYKGTDEHFRNVIQNKRYLGNKLQPLKSCEASEVQQEFLSDLILLP